MLDGIKALFHWHQMMNIQKWEAMANKLNNPAAYAEELERENAQLKSCLRVSNAFYKVAIQQRNSAWREIERLKGEGIENH